MNIRRSAAYWRFEAFLFTFRFLYRGSGERKPAGAMATT
jgi:hypothetical protein